MFGGRGDRGQDVRDLNRDLLEVTVFRCDSLERGCDPSDTQRVTRESDFFEFRRFGEVDWWTGCAFIYEWRLVIITGERNRAHHSYRIQREGIQGFQNRLPLIPQLSGYLPLRTLIT